MILNFGNAKFANVFISNQKYAKQKNLISFQSVKVY